MNDLFQYRKEKVQNLEGPKTVSPFPNSPTFHGAKYISSLYISMAILQNNQPMSDGGKKQENWPCDPTHFGGNSTKNGEWFEYSLPQQ